MIKSGPIGVWLMTRTHLTTPTAMTTPPVATDERCEMAILAHRWDGFRDCWLSCFHLFERHGLDVDFTELFFHTFLSRGQSRSRTLLSVVRRASQTVDALLGF
jgi:hypothetical protein